MTTHIIGVDCATEPANVGLALAKYDGQTCVVTVAQTCRNQDDERPAVIIERWLKALQVTLLARDAPLGWPVPMGQALYKHSAGEFIGVNSNAMFRRATDEAIENRPLKRPLEVGANLIARTALSALTLLHDLRRRTSQRIPLAWEMGIPTHLSVIEVDPAATRLNLAALIKVAPTGKTTKDKKEMEKKEKDAFRRKQIVESIPPAVDVSAVRGDIEASDHALDAVWCAMAAREFIEGRCVAPSPAQLATAMQEGWIWAGAHRRKA